MKRGILVLSLFLISILFISGCVDVGKDLEKHFSPNLESNKLNPNLFNQLITRDWCNSCGNSCPCIGDIGASESSLICYTNSGYFEFGDAWYGGEYSNVVYQGNCAPWYWFCQDC